MRRLLQLTAAGLLFASGRAPAGETINYTYDTLGRVTNVAHSGTVNNGLNTAYTWDAADNRSNVTVTGSSGGGVSFSIGPATATEGNALGFTITKSGTTSSTYTVNYGTANGTAIAGTNYAASSGSLTFLSSDASKPVTVSTVNTHQSASKVMYVNLSSPSGGSTIESSVGAGNINPSSGAVSFSISTPAAVTETQPLVFTVTKSGSTTSTYTVNFATADGSGASGTNYTASSGPLVFGPNETTKTIRITTSGPSMSGSVTMSANLSGASGGASIVTASGTGTVNPYTYTNITDASGKILSSQKSVYTQVFGADSYQLKLGSRTIASHLTCCPDHWIFSIGYRVSPGTIILQVDNLHYGQM